MNVRVEARTCALASWSPFSPNRFFAEVIVVLIVVVVIGVWHILGNLIRYGLYFEKFFTFDMCSASGFRTIFALNFPEIWGEIRKARNYEKKFGGPLDETWTLGK